MISRLAEFPLAIFQKDLKNERVLLKWGWSGQPWDFSRQRHTVKGGSATKTAQGSGRCTWVFPPLSKTIIDLSALDATQHSVSPYTSDCSQNDLLIIVVILYL